jgi:hypothetical protein
MKKLSFDELMKLSPDAAEEYRLAVIEDFITGLPEGSQQRMRAFQWKLEHDLKRFKDPIYRTNRMFTLMWESFERLDVVLQERLPELNANLLDIPPENSI